MRSWSVLLTSVFVFSLQLGCDRPRADGQEREGAPAPSAPAKVVAKAPTPPPPFIEGNWIAQSSLEQVSLGGPTKKKKGSSADENPVAREPTRATGSVSISPRGDLSGSLELLGKKAALIGLAELDEGPVRLRVVDPRLFGSVVLLREGERLSGQLRVSLEEGANTSQLSIYSGTLELSRTPVE